MAEIIGVRFKNVGKIYYFDPDGKQINNGQQVIVETARGVECGEVALPNRIVDDSEIVSPLKKVIRIATAEDLQKITENKKKEQEALEICQQKINEHKLDMKLVDVEYTFRQQQDSLLLHGGRTSRFPRAGQGPGLGLPHSGSSCGRSASGTRPRCWAGLGICGKPVLLRDLFRRVPAGIHQDGQGAGPERSILPKYQGPADRLMCCLKYEQDVYEQLLKITPEVGAIVNSPDGKGQVIDSNLLTGMIKVRLDKNPDAAPRIYNKKELKVIRDAVIRVEKDEIKALSDLEDN